MLLIMAVDNVDAVSFFFVYKNDTGFANKIDARFEQKILGEEEHRYDEYIFSEGLFARQFPIIKTPYKGRQASYKLSNDIVEISDNFYWKSIQYWGNETWTLLYYRYGTIR